MSNPTNNKIEALVVNQDKLGDGSNEIMYKTYLLN